jgi:hypothetical protein
MTPEQTAWVAGILEGEGSFVSGRCIGITVTMTDLDVLQRLQEVTGVGIINALKRRKPNHKDAWVWSVRRRAHIRGIVSAVLPWLGERRSVAAQKLLAKIELARDRADVQSRVA